MKNLLIQVCQSFEAAAPIHVVDTILVQFGNGSGKLLIVDGRKISCVWATMSKNIKVLSQQKVSQQKVFHGGASSAHVSVLLGLNVKS